MARLTTYEGEVGPEYQYASTQDCEIWLNMCLLKVSFRNFQSSRIQFFLLEHGDLHRHSRIVVRVGVSEGSDMTRRTNTP
jgi:hypothetical protein